MGNIKLKNLLRENMRRFGTKNLNEDDMQLDLFKRQSGEYYHNRPELYGNRETSDLGTMLDDLELAIKHQEGKEAIKVAKDLLKFITKDVYIIQQKNKEMGIPEFFAQELIDAVQEVNQDVIEDAIKILNVSPKNTAAMQTLHDIIYDLETKLDH